MGIGQMRILVVDDDAIIAMDTAEILQMAGHEVVGPATTVAQALDMIDEMPVDAAVLDIKLGHEMVWPVAQRLMERRAPFVFLSGFGSAYETPEALRQAPRIEKPVRVEALLGQVAQFRAV